MPQFKSPDTGRAPHGADLWLMVLHDFRQAVQSLWGLAPLAGSGDAETNPRKLEEMIAGLASALTGMIDAVTAIARLETGERGLVRATVPLSELAAASSHRLIELGNLRGTDLVFGTFSGQASTDATHAGTILHGCLLTALKLASNGPIEVTGRPDGGKSTITIAYTGIDPRPALTRTAFVELPGLPSSPAEPFVGLGLALCARLASALDGAVTTGSDGRGRHLLNVAF